MKDVGYFLIIRMYVFSDLISFSLHCKFASTRTSSDGQVVATPTGPQEIGAYHA